MVKELYHVTLQGLHTAERCTSAQRVTVFFTRTNKVKYLKFFASLYFTSGAVEQAKE